MEARAAKKCKAQAMVTILLLNLRLNFTEQHKLKQKMIINEKPKMDGLLFKYHNCLLFV